MTDLILGICVFGHDSSCALVDGETGEILYALTEERFSNVKHDGRFPVASLHKIRERITAERLGTVKHLAFNIDNNISWNLIERGLDEVLEPKINDRLKKDIVVMLRRADLLHEEYFPLNYVSALLTRHGARPEMVTAWTDTVIWHGNFAIRNNRLIQNVAAMFPDAEVVQVDHHEAHAASAFFCSGFADAAVLTLDGQGELATATLNTASGNMIKRLVQTDWPHSIGALYMQLTWYLGFDGDDPRYHGFGDEFKVMGMGAYGEPAYLDAFRRLGSVDEHGKFRLNFGDLVDLVPVQGCRGHSQPLLSKKFFEIFGPRRSKAHTIDQKHYDIAASGQAFLEEIGLAMAKVLRRTCSDTENICIAGGVGLNGLMNMRILQEAGFSNIFIQPAAGDDGSSLGAALHVYHSHLQRQSAKKLTNAFLGLDYGEELIETELRTLGLTFQRPEFIHQEIAKRLSSGALVARYVGRGEFGPRALGHRSILANPTLSGVKEEVNAKIKHREAFRPFAPACLAEHASEFFDISAEAPYMLLIAKAREDAKSRIPAVVHDDNTGRLQSVSQDDNPDFHAIISAFYTLSGTPVVLNTSFNVNGEAIVETPRDAIESFLFMGIDYLAIGPYMVSRDGISDNLLDIDRLELISKRRARYIDTYFSPETYFWSTSNPVEIELQLLRDQVSNLHNIAAERLRVIDSLDAHIKNSGR